jgi:hypothetical protein|tara:strand:+ start:343 stop:2751 length:2409 start_codon:yes stop_codon:yes gene_type:complete
MNKFYALLFCFLMINCSLMGCIGEDDESEDENGDENTSPQYPTRRVEIQPPALLAPQEGWLVTDYALAFTWQRQSFDPEEEESDEDESDEDSSEGWSVDKYQLQVSNVADFSQLSIDVLHDAPGIDQSRIEVGDEFDEESLEIKAMLRHWTETAYLPSETLEEGTWFWRVRAADLANQTWTDPVSFTVTSDTTKTPPTRIISPDAPLFSFDMYDSDGGGWSEPIDWQKYWDFFPADVKPYAAFAVPHEGWGDYASPSRGPSGEVVSYSEFIQSLTDLNIPVLIKTGGPDGDPQNYLSTTELEDLYRNNPNVQGVVTGENTWQAIDGWNNPVYRDYEVKWFQNIIKISAKYGKYVVAGEGSYAFAWDKYLGLEAPENNLKNSNDYVWLDPQILIDNPSTLIPSAKSNIFWSGHQMDSAVFGASIANLVEHHGVWAEAWYWNDAGYSKGVFSDEFHNNGDFSTMPFTTWLQTMLKGVARGATVYHFGGESGVSENRGLYDVQQDAIVEEDGELYFDEDTGVYGDQYSSFWDADGGVTLGFQRYIIPFMQAVVNNDMIPTKQQVLSEIKIAVDAGEVESDKGNYVCYGKYTALYTTLYGIENMMEIDEESEDGDVEESESGCRYELIPNNGRYYSVPVIPHPANSFDIGEIQLVTLDQLQDAEAVKQMFDAEYPDQFTGDAWMNKVGNMCYSTNSHENSNIQQTFGFSFGGALQSMNGNSMPHSYLIASTNADESSIWVHVNAEHGPEYTDSRTTTLEMKWSSQPSTITASPASAMTSQSWDESSSTLTLVLSHSNGAAEVTVSQ